MDDPFSCELSQIRDDTFSKINASGKKYCLQMEKLWIKMFGKKQDVATARYKTVQIHILKMLDDMVNEELETYDEYRRALSELIEESKTLRCELSIEIDIPFEVNVEGINLRKQIKDLKDYLEKYTKIKTERLSLLERYKHDEQKLCIKMGETTIYGSFNEVPSEEKLKEIKLRISTLNTEKTNRQKRYSGLIREIKEILKELEINNFPDPTIEAAVLNGEDFVLSEYNLNKLDEYKINLLDQMENEIKLITELKEKTLILWNRLDISAEERELILMKTNKHCGKSIRDTWMQELERCEQLKKANLKNVILRCREVILALWNDCHMDDEERKCFIDYYNDDFNEELLESHEKEEEKLRKFFSETRELYSLAEKWFDLWNKMISLESRSNNVQRLNNRGGQLLKEEKERKTIQKELPKVESKLEKLISNFESQHNKPFLYDGRPLMDIISLYWDNRRIEKENEKEVRKIQNQTKLTPLKSTCRLLTPSTGPSTRKRGRPLTPVENVIAKKPTAKRELKMPTKTKKEPQKRRSRSHEPITRYGSQRNLRSASANSSVVSYNGFQNYIETKSKFGFQGISYRSSLSPTQSVLGNNGPKSNNIFKTPTSTVKSASKIRRLNHFSSSKIIRPMIN